MQARTYSPFAIAKYFLQKASASDEVTPMKLLKLVYIAHGWNLGLFSEGLITETTQAWKYGPVVPSVYQQYKHFGRKVIPGSEANEIAVDLPEKDNRTRLLLQMVWTRYSSYDGLELSDLTHQVGTPWHTVWHGQTGRDKRSLPIPNKLIRDHYQGLANKRLESAEV